MKHQKKFCQGALCGALAVLLGTGLVSCAGRLPLFGQDAVSSEAEEKLAQIQALINQEYLGEIDEETLQTGIYEGYVGALEDPYSVYYDEEQTTALMETTQGEYGGIGVVLTQDLDTGITEASNVYEDSPAMKAGMQDGDIIYKVDGKDVSGKDLEEISGSIKGEKGSTVEVTVLRGEEQEEVTLTITRDTIQAETVESRMLTETVGYLSISEFDDVTLEQYQEAMTDLEAEGMEGLVMDLRGNPGGNLDTVCQILDLMLPEGLIVYTEDKDGNRQEMVSDEERQIDVPLAVLVDGNSASASEIYAGAIQDYGIGQIVGTQTFGKGVVQSIYDLGDGTSLKLTVAEYFTPNGRSIDGEGITPDVVVEYQRNESDPEADNQLDQAVETLREMME